MRNFVILWVDFMSVRLSFLALLCVIGVAAGQLLFKKAATALPNSFSVFGFLLNGWLICSLILYGVTTLGWIWVLRYSPLYLAYPFMGLAFVLVPILSSIFLGEPLHWRSLAGGAVILVGVILASGN
jgi:drug/metabolite transporter (DMT)-like permease